MIKCPPMPITAVFLGLYLVAMPAYCLFRVFQVQAGIMLLTFAMPLLMSAFAIAHMAGQYGWRNGVGMTLSAIGISLGAEVLGVSTGWLFGDYVYTDQLGPKAFGFVPWLIPFAWLMVLYPAWELTKYDVMADGSKSTFAFHPSSFTLHAVLAALAVTAYDLSLDPRMVADGNWIWHSGGFYFGIPFSNFVGWFITAWVIFVVWGRLIGLREAKTDRSLNSIMTVWAYLVLWIGETIANLFFWSGPVVGLIVFGAMGLFAMPVLWRWQFGKATQEK